MQELVEGTTAFATESEEKISSSMPIFYNPVMKRNRDVSLLVMRTLEHPRIALPMEASGIRAARLVHEIIDTSWQPKEVLINDISPKAIACAKENIARQNSSFDAITFSTMPAQRFLREHGPFEYIDIDPFGTPNPFLDAAVQSLKRGGILAVTATDTSALAGTYPKATARKYWSVPSRTWVMHEMGLRILIRKVQLVGAQYDVALTPLLSLSSDHYYRIFFRTTVGADACARIIAQHAFAHINTKSLDVHVSKNNLAPNGAHTAGPLWVGVLHQKDFVEQLHEHAQRLGPAYEDIATTLTLINDECTIERVGFLDLHLLASLANVNPPRRENFLAHLGVHACRTHLVPTGFKTDLSTNEIIETLKTYSAHTP